MPGHSRRVAYETARLALARVHLDTAGDLAAVAARATRICAEALQVARVGIWVFDDDGTLRCVALHDREQGPQGGGTALAPATLPRYRAALDTCRVLVADDARLHPATAELTAGYLEPHGIGALLDAPVFRDGHLYGVLCHEHVGGARRWTHAEAEFASAVAEVVALMFAQAERARAEAELREQSNRARDLERLLEVRRLARNVAHDFNNVMTSAMMLTASLEPGDLATAQRELSEVLEIGRKLAAELLRFAGPREGATPAGTQGALAGIRALGPVLSLLLRPRAQLVIDVAGDDLAIGLAPLELEQVVLNLCVNARDAISTQGQVSLHARGGTALELEIRDDGVGMDDAVKQHLFEPYFTTKSEGNGMGLVLVLDLVRRAGGTLQIDSAPGRGTTVRVTLPRAP